MAGPLSDLTPYFIYLLLTATLGPLLFGYHLAELNAPAEVITCAKKSIGGTSSSLSQCIPMSPTEFGLVSSSFTLGGLLGALSAGPITTKQGRLRAMLISGIFAAIGPAFEAAASSIGVMTVGRLLSGVGAGMATVVVPIYISEISPPSKRGLFGAFTQIMTNMGILITQTLGLFLSRGQMWRIILGVGGAIAVAQAASLAVAGQESPQWLADHGRTNKARKILQKIRGNSIDIDDEVSAWKADSTTGDINEEEETLLVNNTTTSHQAAPTIGPLAVLQHPDYRPAVFAVVMVMIAQQFTGINSIVMYGVSLLSDLLAANAALLNVVVAAVNVVITTSCAPLVDRLGRKTCLIASIAGMGVSSLLLAVGIMRSVPILSAVAVILFVASFGFGLGPIPFILASELVNSEAVGATQSWALAANWISTFIVAQFFPLVNQIMGKGQVYFLFAGFALAFGSFVAWYVPETLGKRDADEIWGRKKAAVLED
jgi:sugar porter (SP) family MFS transporter